MVQAVDVFLSYAREDRDRARSLAQALQRQGYSVWSDVDIPPGKTFSEVIKKALEDARCVIVMWTRASVRSEWVEIEAANAKARQVLIPVLMDDVATEIPLEFGRMQAAHLVGWTPGKKSPGWAALLSAIEKHVGTSQPTPTPVPVLPTTRAGRIALWSVGAYVAALALEYALSLHLFELRKIGNATQLYGRQIVFDVVLAGAAWLGAAFVNWRAGAAVKNASMKGARLLTWVLGPLPAALFLYSLIVDSQHYLDPGFSFPFYAVLTNAAGYHFMLMVLFVPAWIWLARQTPKS
jgi:hypothetical protein